MEQLLPDHEAQSSSNTALPFELIVRSSTARPRTD
jgi:hypothetical protein